MWAALLCCASVSVHSFLRPVPSERWRVVSGDYPEYHEAQRYCSLKDIEEMVVLLNTARRYAPALASDCLSSTLSSSSSSVSPSAPPSSLSSSSPSATLQRLFQLLVSMTRLFDFVHSADSLVTLLKQQKKDVINSLWEGKKAAPQFNKGGAGFASMCVGRTVSCTWVRMSASLCICRYHCLLASYYLESNKDDLSRCCYLSLPVACVSVASVCVSVCLCACVCRVCMCVCACVRV